MQAEFSFASSVVPYSHIMCMWVGGGGRGVRVGGWGREGVRVGGWGRVLGEGEWGVGVGGVITGSTATYA